MTTKRYNPTGRRNFSKPLHLVCSNDDLRMPMQCVAFANNYAVATNACVLIRQNFELFEDRLDDTHFLNGKFLHRDIFARIFAEHIITLHEDGIKAYDKNKRFVCFYPYSNNLENESYLGEEVIYPQWEKVLEPALTNCKQTTVNYGKIGLNADYIQLLNKVMLFDGLTGAMHFHLPPQNNQGIIVTTPAYDAAIQCALIMPVMVSTSNN